MLRSKSFPDSVRLMVAQAGSSISLVCFLFVVRILAWNILSSSYGSQVVPFYPDNPSEDQVQVANYQNIVDKKTLRESLRLLEENQDCSNLLSCLNFGLDINVENAKDFQRCKRSYLKCKSHGLLPRLNQLLEAVDRVA